MDQEIKFLSFVETYQIGRALDKKNMLYINHLHISLNYIYPRD